MSDPCDSQQCLSSTHSRQQHRRVDKGGWPCSERTLLMDTEIWVSCFSKLLFFFWFLVRHLKMEKPVSVCRLYKHRWPARLGSQAVVCPSLVYRISMAKISPGRWAHRAGLCALIKSWVNESWLLLHRILVKWACIDTQDTDLIKQNMLQNKTCGILSYFYF